MQPFDKHQASPDALEGCGSNLVTEGATALQNGTSTREAYAPAIDAVTGVCAPEIQAADQPVQDASGSAEGQLVWASVVTRYWGSQVRAFNTRVDEITAGLAGQGPDYGAEGTGGEDPTDEQVDEARAAATAAARRDWWTAHSTYVTDGGTTAASMLEQGPTAANMQIARDAGAMPPMEVDAWGTFVNGLRGLAVPPSDRDGWTLASWTYGTGMRPAGWLSTIQQYRGTRFAPRWPNGRFMSMADFNSQAWRQRVTGYTNSANRVPRPGQAGAMARWGRFDTIAKRGGWVVAGATGAWDQWTRDEGRTDLDNGDRAVRATTRGALNAAGGAAGAWAGAKGGAMLGAAIGGPVGAAIGGVAGGIIGGVIGSGLGNKVADWAMEGVTDFADDAKEKIGDAADWAGDKISKLKFW